MASSPSKAASGAAVARPAGSGGCSRAVSTLGTTAGGASQVAPGASQTAGSAGEPKTERAGKGAASRPDELGAAAASSPAGSARVPVAGGRTPAAEPPTGGGTSGRASLGRLPASEGLGEPIKPVPRGASSAPPVAISPGANVHGREQDAGTTRASAPRSNTVAARAPWAKVMREGRGRCASGRRLRRAVGAPSTHGLEKAGKRSGARRLLGPHGPAAEGATAGSGPARWYVHRNRQRRNLSYDPYAGHTRHNRQTRGVFPILPLAASPARSQSEIARRRGSRHRVASAAGLGL